MSLLRPRASCEISEYDGDATPLLRRGRSMRTSVSWAPFGAPVSQLVSGHARGGVAEALSAARDEAASASPPPPPGYSPVVRSPNCRAPLSLSPT